MCRHLAYLGPRLTLEDLLITPKHSLLRQSFEPRYQTHGTVNADGFGAGWYDRERRPEPARYRTSRPMWSDASFASLAGLVSSTTVLAAVRSASPGIPVEESSTAPFTTGPWLFSHNGIVPGFHHGVGRQLRQRVSDERASGIVGASDSELLFALVLDRLDKGASPGEALTDVVRLVQTLTVARLNLLLTDGERVAATACRNSLFVLDDRLLDGALLIASEPYDDDTAWEVVPDGSVIELADDKLTTRPF